MFGRRPRAPLSEFVSYLWAVQGYVAGPHRHEWILPSGNCGLLVQLGDRSWNSIVSGPHSRAFEIGTADQFAVAGVVFKPGGVYPFVGIPVRDLTNAHVALDDLWGGLAGELHERVREESGIEAQVDRLESILTARLVRGRARRPEIAYALARFEQDPGVATVAHVIEQVGMSHRRFLDLFTSEVGLTPKVFCRLRRFRRVLDRVSDRRVMNWTEIALACGYYDQAHFIHDFRSFAGMSPTAYERYRVSLNHVAILD